MALFKGTGFDNLKKKASEGLQAAQEKTQGVDLGAAIRKAASDVAEKADGAAKAIGEGAKDFDAARAVRNAADAASSGLAAASRAIGGAPKEEAPSEENSGAETLVNLLCCFAACDGEITTAEKEKIAAIANDLSVSTGGDFSGDNVVQAALGQLDADSREFEYVVAAKVGAQRILENMTLAEQEKRSLCWNLYALAYADGATSTEIDFIRFVCEKSGVNPAAAEELGAYAAAIYEIGEEKKKLAGVDRSYREVGPLVDELSKREQVLMEAAWALVSDSDI